MVFMEESELSSKRWASAPRRPDSPCVLGAPTSREAAGPPVQLEPVDLSVKTPVVLQVPRYSPAAALITAARRIPSPSTTPTPPPLCASTDLDAKFHTKVCCCCFNLKTGSTIIAGLNLVSAVISTILLFNSTIDELDIEDDSNAYVLTISGKTAAGRVARILLNVLVMIVSGSMLWGNIKGDKKLMLPYVYVGLVALIGIAVMGLIAVLTLFFIGAFLAGFIIFFFILIIILLQLYYWEVVRCRVLELDQLEQPRSGYTQQDPELPAYGDIQGTTAMNIGGHEKSPLAYPNDQINYD